MFSPHFPAYRGIALRGIALLLEVLRNRKAFRLFIQKPRQFLETDAVNVMCQYFSGLIQQDNIADRQAVAVIIHGLSTVEFLIQLLQQFRLRNAALSGRKIATVENLVIFNNKAAWSWVHCRVQPADTASCSGPVRYFPQDTSAQSGYGLH